MSQRKCSLCHQPGHTKRKCLNTVIRERDNYEVSITKSIPKSKCNMKIKKEKDSCCICFENISPTSNNVTTPCKHKFCFTCIAQHLETSKKCPICRQSLFKEKPKPKPKTRMEYMVPIQGGGSVPLSRFISDPEDYVRALEMIQDLSPVEVSEIIATIIRSR